MDFKSNSHVGYTPLTRSFGFGAKTVHFDWLEIISSRRVCRVLAPNWKLVVNAIIYIENIVVLCIVENTSFARTKDGPNILPKHYKKMQKNTYTEYYTVM